MKRLSAVFFVLCTILLSATLAGAHPPKSVNLSWDNGTLTVKVEHSVNDPQKHYIYKIVVYVDNQVAAQKDYTSQPDAAGLTDRFALPSVKSGANVKAEAFCVIMGSTTGSITIP